MLYSVVRRHSRFFSSPAPANQNFNKLFFLRQYTHNFNTPVYIVVLSLSMEMAEYIVSKKNKPKFTHNGYLFVLDKHSKEDHILKFWRCERKKECKARIYTKDDVVITEINEHSHSASVASVEIAAIKTSLKRRAEACQNQPSTVINSCTENISKAAQGELPNTDSMTQMVELVISFSPYILFQFQLAPK